LNLFPLVQSDPTTRAEALASDQKEEWLAAEQAELQSIQERSVWTLVDKKPGMNVLGCRFVYKTKRKPDGTIERFKVRLVAQGFKQKEGIDFHDVFATTVAWQSVRIVLWLAVFYKMLMVKIDIKTFFLYGDLKETIYMKQPPGYTQGDKVCKLVKSLYGLKQSMRCALETLAKALRKQGVEPLVTDPNVFFRRNGEDVIIVCAWVDDLLCFFSSDKVKKDFIRDLEESFELTIEEEPTDYLQMEILRNRERKILKMHQGGYVRKLLTTYQMESCNPQKVPMVQGVLPLPKDLEPSQQKPYMELIGSLIWLLRTRVDLSVTVNLLARYMNRYSDEVYQSALKVLRYLKGCPDDGICYDLEASKSFAYGDGVEVVFEVDSDWGGDGSDSKSTTGWLVKFNGTVVGCQTKNQSRPAVSTGEAELNGLEFVGKEVEWVGDFLNELQILAKRPFTVFQDNDAALALTKDPVMRPRTKYFRIAQHYVRWLQVVGKAKYEHRPGADLCADFLTKLQPRARFVVDKRTLMGNQNCMREQQSGICLLMHDDYLGRVGRAAEELRRAQAERDAFEQARLRRWEMYLSRSSHNPAMMASCPSCDHFLKWLPRKDDWEECGRCDELKTCYCCNRFVCVVCSECHGTVWYHRKLQQWICHHCNEHEGVLTRSVRNREGI
jgi:histone deacetylase 1/2